MPPSFSTEVGEFSWFAPPFPSHAAEGDMIGLPAYLVQRTPSELVAYAVVDWFPPGAASYHILHTFGASRRIARGPILSWS